MHFKCVHTYVFSLHESEKIKYLHMYKAVLLYICRYLQSLQLQAGHATGQPSPSVLLLSCPAVLVLICGWTSSPFRPPIILFFYPHMWQDSPPSVLIFGQNSLPLPTSCPPFLLFSCVGRTAFTSPLPVLLSPHRRKGQLLPPYLLSSYRQGSLQLTSPLGAICGHDSITSSPSTTLYGQDRLQVPSSCPRLWVGKSSYCHLLFSCPHLSARLPHLKGTVRRKPRWVKIGINR
jgi:hypothetical protein